MVLLHALKCLWRTPVYAVTVILTLALGLASVGTMFAVVHALLLKPLPYGDPDRLVSINLELADGTGLGHSPAVQATYRRFATQIEDVALYRSGSANVWTPNEDVRAEHTSASWISASTIPLLKTPPLLGRTFSADEEHRGGPDAVILSEREWRTRFGASPDVIGQTLIVNDVAREIIGVMPASFAFPSQNTRLWLPAKYSGGAEASDFFYSAIARLAPGATMAGARQELSATFPRIAELFPRLRSGGSTASWIAEVQPAVRVRSLHEAVTGGIRPTLWTLAAIAALVLVVAWANVANLILIRADASRQSIAIREALGARPMRASAHLLNEAVLLGSAAAALALIASFGAVMAFKTFGPTDLPRQAELAFGPGVAGLVIVLALAGTLISTLVLSRIGQSGHLSRKLHSGARTQTSGKTQQRVRATATVLQIATALVVLSGSALLLRTAQRLHEVHPGFADDGVTTFRILLPFARYSASARVAFHARLIEEVSQLPTVQAASLTAVLPLGTESAPEQSFRVAGAERRLSLPMDVVGNGYFAAMGIPMFAGHDFGTLESQRAGDLIISKRAAMVLFSDPDGADAIGRTLRLEPAGPVYTVVGVVGDVLYEDLSTPPRPVVYRPQVVATTPDVDPEPLAGMVLVVRSEASPEALVTAVRQVVHTLDPSIPVFDVSSMHDVVRGSMARLTLMLWAMTAAGAATLALGMIGLYGVMAYSVTLRTREFGLRMALGVDPRRLARWVVSRGLVLTATGMLVGLALFSVAAPTLRTVIAGVVVWDPLPVMGVIVLLALTSLLACWFPALRAAAVDPVQALRAE